MHTTKLRTVLVPLSSIILVIIFSLIAGNTPGLQAVASDASPMETLINLNHRDGLFGGIAAADDYLAVGFGPRLVIFSATSANRLEPIGQTSTLAGTVVNIVVANDVAYVATSTASLYAIDIKNPQTPTIMWHTPFEARRLSVFGNLLAVASSWDGLTLYDISTPLAPAYLGKTQLPDTLSNITGLVIAGDHAYVTGGKTLSVVSVANPVAPSVVWSVDTDNAIESIAVSDNRAYITGSGLTIYSLNNPEMPVRIGRYDENQATGALYVKDHFAYVNYFGAGMRLLDVEDAANVRRLNLTGGGDFEEIVAFNSHFVLSHPSQLYFLNFDWSPATIPVYSTLAYRDIWAAGGGLLFGFTGTDLIAFDVRKPNKPRLGSSVNISEYNYYDFYDMEVDLASAKGLAFLAARDGLYAFRATPDGTLSKVGYIHLNAPNNIYISGDYAYLTSYDGLDVVNISDPVNPRPVSKFESVKATSISGNGDKLYLREYNSHPDATQRYKLTVLSITQPERPTLLGALVTSTPFDEIASVGSTVYGLGTNDLLIFDASNPATPRLDNTQRIGGFEKILLNQNRLYLSRSGGTLLILDTTDTPLAPTAFEEIQTFVSPSDIAVAVTGDTVYTANYSGGMLIYSWASSESVTFPGGGASFQTHDGRFAYRFDNDSFPGLGNSHSIEFTHTTVAPETLPSLPPLIQTGIIFENLASVSDNPLTGSDVGDFEVTINYDEGALGAIDEDTLSLYYFEDGAWEPEPTTTVNASKNQVTANPQRFGQWGLVGKAQYGIYLASVSLNSGTPTPTIVGIEITQGVQGLKNHVPLVAGKKALVRVHATVAGVQPLDRTSLVLEGTRNGQPLPGSPLRISDWAVFPQHDRAKLNHSFNFDLPSSWLNGDVTLRAGFQSWWGSTSQGSITTTAHFNEVPPLRVILVPVEAHNKASGITCAAPQAINPDVFETYLLNMFPVSDVQVTVRSSPVSIEGYFPHDVLNAVTALKSSDGIPAEVIYYGVVGGKTPSSPVACDFMGIGGQGWLGQRVAFGTIYPSTMAHETGHNMNLLHAPCGGAASTDPNYPYAFGSIGEYGYDRDNSHVWSPGNPVFAKDFMSYCSPEWISDYHYRKLYDDQRANGVVAKQDPPQTALLIRVVRNSEGFQILPVYQLETIPTAAPEIGDLFLELLDDAGGILATHPLKLDRAEEEGINIEAAIANIPIGNHPNVAYLRVRDNNGVVAERALNNAADFENEATLVTHDERQDGISLMWSAADRPTLIRFRNSDTNEWITYTIDFERERFTLTNAMIPVGSGFFEIIAADVIGDAAETRVSWVAR